MAEEEPVSTDYLEGLDTEGMAEGAGISRFRIKLQMVRGKYAEDEIRFPKMILTYLTRSGQGTTLPLGLQLAVELEPEAAAALSQVFTPLEAVINDYVSYLFEMKPEVFNRHAEAFDQAIRLEDWFAPGDGAVVDLQNYNCLGYIDLSSDFKA